MSTHTATQLYVVAADYRCERKPVGPVLGDTGAQALLRRASGLLDSQHPNHQAAGRAMHARAQRAEQLATRERRLLASQHPGNTDGRYRAACTHAERWGLRWAPRGVSVTSAPSFPNCRLASDG